MKASTLETWIWVLIYGGLVGVLIGAFTLSFDEVLGHSLVWSGAAVAALGAVGIWLRSRLRGDAPAPGPKP
ncbi:hypothetical protein [Caldimonas sp. KR1-144]|uniref:hypothetical protein n=1 Tax=Caldimonas sp. KR1-144 TaxID=3400911 RepID=UPI003C099CF3